MRLNFSDINVNESHTLATTALSSNHLQRVEIHIKDNLDKTFTLIALSGPNNQLPTKTLRQGPFYAISHARSARTAINNELLRSGFKLTDDASIWEIKAQSEVNRIREIKEKNKMNYKFDPKDVYFDY
ncbi:hypothetical protein MAH1_04260 [Sessilibacter sp. MAH1]